MTFPTFVLQKPLPVLPQSIRSILFSTCSIRRLEPSIQHTMAFAICYHMLRPRFVMLYLNPKRNMSHEPPTSPPKTPWDCQKLAVIPLKILKNACLCMTNDFFQYKQFQSSFTPVHSSWIVPKMEVSKKWKKPNEKALKNQWIYHI